MARPTKPRNIRKLPAATTFKPVHSKSGQAVTELGLDEFPSLSLINPTQNRDALKTAK